MVNKSKFLIIIGIILAGCLVMSGSFAADIDAVDADTPDLQDGAKNQTWLDVSVAPGTIIYEGNSVTVNIEVGYDDGGVWETYDNASGNVNVTIDGNTVNAEVKNGLAQAVFKNGFSANNYTITASYSGDDNYYASTGEGSFYVYEKVATNVNVFAAPGADYYEGEPLIVDVEIGRYNGDVWDTFEDASGYVYVTVNGVTLKAKVVNGIAKVVFKDGFSAGDYTIYAFYSGDDKYESSYGNDSVTIYKKDIPSKKYNDGSSSESSLADTGNPLLVLVIALATIGLGSLRRKF